MNGKKETHIPIPETKTFCAEENKRLMDSSEKLSNNQPLVGKNMQKHDGTSFHQERSKASYW